MAGQQSSQDARSAANEGRPGMISQYLIFSLGGEAYAVGTLRVREIIEYGTLTAVPMVPPFIRGVINLRGAVVPVIDLNARFGRARTEASRRTCIVILEVNSRNEGPQGRADGSPRPARGNEETWDGPASPHDRQVLGIIVDAVSAVRRIDAADVEPPPNFGTGIRADFIEGMAKVNGQFVILLELASVLSVDEIALLGGLAAGGSPTPALAPALAA